MKNNDNNLFPVILLGIVILFGLSSLAFIGITEDDDDDEETDVPLPPNLYSSSYHIIGTGNKLGTYFPAGQVLENWFNGKLDSNGGAFKALSTNGSTENIQLLQTKRIQFGMTESRVAKEAYAKNSDIRVVWPLWLDVAHFIKPPSDLVPDYEFPGRLKGFAGQKWSSTARTTKEIFAALNITGRHTVDIPINKILESIGDGRLSFAMIQAGLPNKSVSDSIVFKKCGLVDFSKEQIESMLSNVSTSVSYTIPAGYYDDTQPEINTIALPNVFVSTVDVSADLVEYVTDMLVKANSGLKNRIKTFETLPDNAEEALKIMKESGIPLHEGTKNWLKKNGFLLNEGDNSK